MIELPNIVVSSTVSTIDAYQEDTVTLQPLVLNEEGLPETLNDPAGGEVLISELVEEEEEDETYHYSTSDNDEYYLD